MLGRNPRLPAVRVREPQRWSSAYGRHARTPSATNMRKSRPSAGSATGSLEARGRNPRQSNEEAAGAQRMAAATLSDAILRRVAALADHAGDRAPRTAVASTPSRTGVSEPRPRQAVRCVIRARAARCGPFERVHQQDAPHAGIDTRRSGGRRLCDSECGPRSTHPGAARTAPPPRHPRGADEFVSLLDASARLDRERHRPATLARAAEVRKRCATTRGVGIGQRSRRSSASLAEAGVLPLRLPRRAENSPNLGHRGPVIATLALAGPRVNYSSVSSTSMTST